MISLGKEVWAYKTCLTPPLFIEVPAPCQERDQLYICVFEILSLPLFTMLIFDFIIVPTVWYFFGFPFY
jgi:hypothetical protein